MFGKKDKKPEEPKVEFHYCDYICKFCNGKSVYPLHGGNWIDSGDVVINKTFGDKSYPEFKQFKIVFCSDCGKLTEVEHKE